MGVHVFKPCIDEGHRNIIVMRVPLWHRQVDIEVAGKQQLQPAGKLSDGHDNSIYGLFIVWGDILPHEMPPLPSRRQQKSGDIWSVETEHLRGEAPRLAVEDGNFATMRSWLRSLREPIPSWIHTLNSPHDIFLLIENKIQIHLWHTRSTYSILSFQPWWIL